MVRGWKRYLENELTTSNPMQITIMAYEKCILELRFAKDKIENLRFIESDTALTKVERIIQELGFQLNHDDLPELSQKIQQLYDWLLDEIQSVKITKKSEKIEPMVRVIQNLLDGYRGALNKHE